MKKIGVILVNLGSPSAPTPKAVSDYLWQFLRDPRVVDLPRWKWYPLLKGIILPHRAKKVAKTYQNLWTVEGSLLIAISKAQQKLLQAELNQGRRNCSVALAMTYGKPSIEDAVIQLQNERCEKLIILPLFPQYSSSTTGAVFDAFARVMQKRRNLPPFHFIHSYADNENYIQALANSIQRHHNLNDFLLFSYHGIPLRYEKEGDSYRQDCEKTTKLVVEKLGLKPKQWAITFQSRFGREEWLCPYTDTFIQQAPSQGIKKLSVICPGFASDCLETVEEIDQENRERFLQNGGKSFNYIPALNAHSDHIHCLAGLIQKYSEF